MFSTKGQEVKTSGGTVKSLQPGVVYAHIYSGNVKTSKDGNKKSLELVLEGPAIPDFEGWSIDKNDPEGPKFKGLSSRVSATIWTDQHGETNATKNEIMYKIIIIAKELGLRDAVDSISANSLENWVAQALDILKGHDLYWFLNGKEEEYNGKTIVKVSLPKFKFCSVDENKLDKFDKNNQYHYKALPQNKSVSGFEPVNNDFDM
jgi:hypothetical protein